MLHVGTKLKPGRWAVSPGVLSEEARNLWRDLVFAAPFWDGAVMYLEDVASRLVPTMGGGMAVSNWVATEYGWALNFSGASNQRVTFADPPTDILDGFSRFSVWILFRATGVGSVQGLIGKYSPSAGARSWRLYLDLEELELQVSSDGTGNETQQTTDANLVANTWYQALVTFDAGVFRAWVDGVEKDTDANFQTHLSVFNGNQGLIVANREDGAGLAGDVAAAAVWGNRVLQEADARLLLANPFILFDPALGVPSLALESLTSVSQTFGHNAEARQELSQSFVLNHENATDLIVQTFVLQMEALHSPVQTFVFPYESEATVLKPWRHHERLSIYRREQQRSR